MSRSFIYACGIIEFMTENMTENSCQRHLANNHEVWTMRAATPGEDARSNSSAVAGATWWMLIKLLTEARKVEFDSRDKYSGQRPARTDRIRSFFRPEDGYLQLICDTFVSIILTPTNHDDQLGESYPTMLNEPNCAFGVSFSCSHCCGRHGHGLWSSWYRPCLIN